MEARLTADTRRRIAGHVANLGRPDDGAAQKAERRLIRFGTKVVDVLIAVAADPRPQVRCRAAWALGKIRDSRAFPALRALTEDTDEAVRYDATLALGELGDTSAVPFLEALARRIPREDSRLGAALTALMELAGGERNWARFVACAWYKELADTREDIYTLEVGEPLDTPR